MGCALGKSLVYIPMNSSTVEASIFKELWNSIAKRAWVTLLWWVILLTTLVTGGIRLPLVRTKCYMMWRVGKAQPSFLLSTAKDKSDIAFSLFQLFLSPFFFPSMENWVKAALLFQGDLTLLFSGGREWLHPAILHTWLILIVFAL